MFLQKKAVVNASIFSCVIAAVTLSSDPGSAGISIKYEDPGVQQSSLVTGINVITQTFDGISAGYYSTGFKTNIGTFDHALIETADQYGGANGTGNYFDVDTLRSGTANSFSPYTTSTLTLNSAQTYLGLWWSAGDVNNILDLYSHGALVKEITTNDVKASLSFAYYGNPTSPFYGKDSLEPFAYLNVYADNGTSFDQIKFTNIGDTGFEVDNLTVASVPEPNNLIGLGALAAIAFIGRRQLKLYCTK
jgi:hypothetical protein